MLLTRLQNIRAALSPWRFGHQPAESKPIVTQSLPAQSKHAFAVPEQQDLGPLVQATELWKDRLRSVIIKSDQLVVENEGQRGIFQRIFPLACVVVRWAFCGSSRFRGLDSSSLVIANVARAVSSVVEHFLTEKPKRGFFLRNRKIFGFDCQFVPDSGQDFFGVHLHKSRSPSGRGTEFTSPCDKPSRGHLSETWGDELWNPHM